jgi:hypothetical protein
MHKIDSVVILFICLVLLNHFHHSISLEKSLENLLEWKSRHIDVRGNRSHSPIKQLFQWMKQMTNFLLWGTDPEDLDFEIESSISVSLEIDSDQKNMKNMKNMTALSSQYNLSSTKNIHNANNISFNSNSSLKLNVMNNSNKSFQNK